MGPNDIVVDRWDLNHLLWTLASHPVPEHRHEREDLERCTDRLVEAMLSKGRGARSVPALVEG